MRYPHARILLFAKAPEPGQVKTRLIPAVGAQHAAAIYRELLVRMIGEASADIAPLDIWCAPDTRHGVFQAAAQNRSVTLHPQVMGDLGQRMAHGAEQALARSQMVLLIGGDCPVLTGGHLCRALAWLESGADAVLGPAEDGGYVLLGLRRMEHRLFSDIPWGTDQVLAITRRRLAQQVGYWRELEPLWDLDREADLDRYRQLSEPAMME